MRDRDEKLSAALDQKKNKKVVSAIESQLSELRIRRDKLQSDVDALKNRVNSLDVELAAARKKKTAKDDHGKAGNKSAKRTGRAGGNKADRDAAFA